MNVKDYEYTLLAQRKERSEPNRTGAGSIPARRINGKERKRNTMTKEKKQDGGWQFPKALEIVKCKEGNKEFMKERPARRPFGNTVLICEYPLDGDAIQEPNARMITWRLAKRAARDFLRVSFMTSAIVTATKVDKPFTVVRVYGRY